MDSRTEDTGQSWFVVKTNHLAEKKVNERILKLGFETYLPLITTLRVWSDRKKKVQVPLISSHLFVFTTRRELLQIYPIAGVAGVLKEFGHPAIVRQTEIENLRILTKSQEPLEEASLLRLHEGDDVEVIAGVFTGLIGKSVCDQDGFKVTIFLDSLGAGWTIVAPQNSVRKL